MNGDYQFKIPDPTPSELKLREILRSKNIPYKYGKVIWYTACNNFTPDLIIGNKLIIEVDGKIHDKEYQKTSDRIRQRALENMGYIVLRVRNEEIRNAPNVTAERISEKYFELDNSRLTDSMTGRIIELKKPVDYEPISKVVANNLEVWAVLFNKEINDKEWSIDLFKKSLLRYHHDLIENQCAIERLFLLLHGLNLRKTKDDMIDFEFSLNFLKKSIEILDIIFGEDNMAGIHLKNMFNITAPNFFKNLIFKGGPNINPGLIVIKDKYTLNSHIDNFNKYLSILGITVEHLEIKEECKITLEKFHNKEKANFNWLIDWMKNIT